MKDHGIIVLPIGTYPWSSATKIFLMISQIIIASVNHKKGCLLIFKLELLVQQLSCQQQSASNEIVKEYKNYLLVDILYSTAAGVPVTKKLKFVIGKRIVSLLS